jgi:hypothetical protein
VKGETLLSHKPLPSQNPWSSRTSPLGILSLFSVLLGHRGRDSGRVVSVLPVFLSLTFILFPSTNYAITFPTSTRLAYGKVPP